MIRNLNKMIGILLVSAMLTLTAAPVMAYWWRRGWYGYGPRYYRPFRPYWYGPRWHYWRYW